MRINYCWPNRLYRGDLVPSCPDGVMKLPILVDEAVRFGVCGKSHWRFDEYGGCCMDSVRADSFTLDSNARTMPVQIEVWTVSESQPQYPLAGYGHE